MNRRRQLAWFSPLLLILALLFQHGEVASAQERGGRNGRAGRDRARFARTDGRSAASLREVRNEFVLHAPANRVAAIAARRGLTVIRRLNDSQDVFLVSGPSRFGSRFEKIREADKSAVEQLVGEVQDDPDVELFEVNALVVTPEVASGNNLNGSLVEILDTLTNRGTLDFFGHQAWTGYVNQPATNAIRLPSRRAAGATGGGIVAIIDTGVDPYHPLLTGSLVPGYDFVRDIAGDASEWKDLDGSLVEILDGSQVSILDQVSPVLLNGSTVAILDSAAAGVVGPSTLPAAFGHGTMVAGLVHLVAPTAKIMPLKAFRADGTSTVFDIVRAIHYAIDHGARIINMSFSATLASPEIAHAINVATSRGIICVASAGNSGQELLVYPGALRNVIGVGSTSSHGQPTRSWFSNYGASLVSLGAPGEGVITTYPGGGYAAVWGTSFSTPLAAGAAALLLQLDSTVDQAKADSLLGNADRMDAGMGKGRLNLDQAVRVQADGAPPAVSINAPTGGVVFGNVRVAASASDNLGVAGVMFLLDGSPIAAEDTQAPYELTWTTAAASNGSHVLTAVARDAAGNQTTATTVSVTVANDSAAPAIVLTSPAAGATVGGTVMMAATASDNAGVVGVTFILDETPLAEDTSAPYEVAWATANSANGAHTVTAVARDAAGNQTTATTVTVTVGNDVTPPVVAVTAPAPAATVSGTVMLAAAATDDTGVVGVQFTLDGAPLGAEATTAPYALAWNTASAASGAHTVTAVARDAAGHVAASAAITVTVAHDTIVPAVAVTSPAADSTVSGTVTLAATASDDVGVAGVLFTLDGAPLGTEHPTAPYQLAWSTTGVANGTHTLAAVARDTTGNLTTATVIVTVANDRTAPAVAVIIPVAANSVAGTVTLTAAATDDVGVAGVQFTLDGTAMGPEDTTPPFELAWSTTAVANGTHALAAIARDATGNQTTATGVIVNVANDTTATKVELTTQSHASTVAATVSLAASATDDVGVAGVQFTLNGAPLGPEDTTAPYELAWSTASVANGTHTLAAIARDATGNQTTATGVIVTVANDAIPPTVALVSPAVGTTVDGIVTVVASASDNVGIVGVEFRLDGTPIGADLTAPYELSWVSATAPNGPHTLTAVARDAAGHETAASAEVTVTNVSLP